MKQLIALLIFMLGAPVSWANNYPSVPFSLTIVPSVTTQTIASVTAFTSSIKFTAATNNAVVGTVVVTMSPGSPPFTGALSITGANSCGFYLVGNTVQANATNAATTCTTTGGPHGNGLYDDWNVVATQSGISNSPFTQAEAATAVALSQAVASVTTFTPSTQFTAATNNATVGTVSVTLSPASPAFTGALSITGANSCGFHLTGNVVQASATNAATLCTTTGGPHSNGLYDDWNVVATQTGVTNSPFTQAEAATAVTVTQVISQVTTFTAATTFTGGVTNAVVGVVGVAVSPGNPAFSGTLTVGGANSCGFHIVGNQLEAGTGTNCLTTGGPHGNGLYDDWTLVATQAGISNSPFTQVEAATATAAPAQQIGVITQFNTMFAAATPNVPIGNLTVRMCPTLARMQAAGHACYLTDNVPPFAGTLSIAGNNSCGFYLNGNTVLTGPNAATQCTTTGGPHGNGVYDDWSVVATQTGIVNSPFTQPESATAETVSTTTPQWVVTHHDGCFLVSGSTTDFSCQLRWRDGFSHTSMVVAVGWRGSPSATGTAPAITTVSFTNSPAACNLIPGTLANDSTTGIASAMYLCPNLPYPASAFDIVFASPTQFDVVATTELYGCANPCVAEVGNSVVSPKANGVMSVSTNGATTATNELILSFTYGPSDTFSSPTGTLVNNATFGVGSWLTQYQIGATTGTYTNSVTTSFANSNVLQSIVAFKRDPAPPVVPPATVGQQTFTVTDLQAGGTPVAGDVHAYTADFSPVLGPITLSINPGGLLALNAAGNGFVLVRTLTAADDGTYAGQLSVTQASTTINQPISLIVQPTRTYQAGASNCPSTPPPAAQRAGLIYRAYCLDPMNTRYQTLSNWINCTEGSNPPGFEWYPTFPSLTCRDLSVIPDPQGSGRNVLEFHWHSTDDINYIRSVKSSANFIKAVTTACGLQGCVPSVQIPMTNSYIEFRASNYPLVNDKIFVQDAPNIFVWSNCLASTVNCNDLVHPEHALIEEDLFESFGPRAGNGGAAFHWWNDISFGYSSQNTSTGNTNTYPTAVPGWDQTKQFSYGVLTTSDASGFRLTSYLNDVLAPPIPSVIGRAMPGGAINPNDIGVLPSWDPLGFDNRGIFSQPHYWNLWLGGTFGLQTPDCQSSRGCVAEGGQPDTFVDFQYIADWVCGPQYLTDPYCGKTPTIAQ